MAKPRNHQLRPDVWRKEVQRSCRLCCIHVSLFAFQDCGFEDGEGFEYGHVIILRGPEQFVSAQINPSLQITPAGTLTSSFHIDNSDRTISDQTTITNAPRTTMVWRELASMVTKLTQVRGHHYFAAKWFVKGADGRRLPKKSLYDNGSGCLSFIGEVWQTGALAQLREL